MHCAAVEIHGTKEVVMGNVLPNALCSMVTVVSWNQCNGQLVSHVDYKRSYIEYDCSFAGCLPSLATIPVFIGLYNSLTNVANSGRLDSQGFFWLPSLAGPTSLAARSAGHQLFIFLCSAKHRLCISPDLLQHLHNISYALP